MPAFPATFKPSTLRRPQVAPGNLFDYLVNGFLIGSDLALMQNRDAVFILGSLVLMAASVLFNVNRLGGIANVRFRLGPAAWLGLALLLVNVLIMTVQSSQVDGLKFGIKECVSRSAFLVLLVSCVLRFGGDYLRPTHISLSLAFAWFAVLNLIAERLGIGFEVLQDRTTAFTSNFSEGAFRWQAPLLSSWQLSGLLRWAIPIMGLHLWLYSRRNWVELTVVAVALLGSVGVAVRCEYRAAVFPLGGALVWLVISSYRGRGLLSLAFLLYTLTIPFVITQPWVGQFLQTNMPDFALRMAGSQNLIGVLTLSGRSVMWEGAIEVLASGKYLWAGQGHVLLNAAIDIGGQDAASAQLFARLGYHQGMLDILFIYGVVPGALLLLVMLFAMGRGVFYVFKFKKGAISGPAEVISLALFSIGMVALSNCHDGFVLEHNIFYFICIVALCAISDSVVILKAAQRGKNGDRSTSPTSAPFPAGSRGPR